MASPFDSFGEGGLAAEGAEQREERYPLSQCRDNETRGWCACPLTLTEPQA